MAERKVTKEVSGSAVIFTFHDGEALTASLETLSPEIVNQLALHGLSQKIGDSYAGEDAANCQTIAEAVWKSLTEGNWSTRTGEGGGPRISQLAEALARVTGQTVQDCVAKIAEMSDDQKKDLRAHPQIKAVTAEIKLEKARADAEKAKNEAGAGDDSAIDLGSMF